MWRHVFLDFGGTLAQELSPRHEIYADAARAQGWRLAPEAVRAAMATAHARLPRRLGPAWRYNRIWFRRYMTEVFSVELGCPERELEALAERLFDHFANPQSFQLREGALELLDALRHARLGSAIVSNWSYALPDLLRGLGIARRVDAILCSALEGCEKPEAAFFELALARTGAKAATTLHVGDRFDLDCQGARGVGITPVWLCPPDAVQPAGFEANLLRVSSLPELTQLILAGRA